MMAIANSHKSVDVRQTQVFRLMALQHRVKLLESKMYTIDVENKHWKKQVKSQNVLKATILNEKEYKIKKVNLLFDGEEAQPARSQTQDKPDEPAPQIFDQDGKLVKIEEEQDFVTQEQ